MSDNLIQLTIKEDFGDSAAKIANLLIQNEELSLDNLATQSKLSFDEMKQILVLLIKHNIIFFVSKTSTSNVGQKEPLVDMNEDYVYRISTADVLYRLRFPKFLFHISKIFGSLCQIIIEAFIGNGRLTVSDCVAEIEEHMKQKGINIYSEKEILEATAALIKGQYIVQVDKSNYSLDLYSLSKVEQTKQELGGGKRKARVALKESEIIGKGTKKTKVNPIDELNMLSSDGLAQDIKVKLGQEADMKQKKGKSLKEEYARTNPLFFDSLSNKEYIFKINYRKFIHDFRTEYILEIISSRINELAGIIVQAMLRDSQLFSRASQFKQTEAYTVSEITEKLSHYKAISEESVNRYLKLLQTEKFVEKVINTSSYCVDMDYLVAKLQMKALEKVIEEKFSKNHARIFRTLENLGYLDEKQISDTSLMPIKQARSCLMDLISFRVAECQDLPGDQGKANQLYGVRPQQALANLIEETHKTLFSLKKREEMEMEKLKSLIGIYASEEEQDKTRELINKLELAIIELNETIMLFCEF